MQDFLFPKWWCCLLNCLFAQCTQPQRLRLC